MPTDDAILPGAIGQPWAPGYPITPAWWLWAMRPFDSQPTMLIWHSGATGDNVVKYLANPTEPECTKGAVLCRDGKWRRQVGTHFASTTRNGDYRSMVPLDVAAWGVQGYNGRAIHIEAPAHQGPDLARQSRELAATLVQVVPSLREWSLHRWLQDNRHDPVCWSDDEVREVMAGSGLAEGR